MNISHKRSKLAKRTTQTKLTIYRRHAGSCPVDDPARLDACECPLWCHGRVRGRLVRRALDTRSLIAAVVRRDELLAGRNDDDPTPTPGAGPVRVRPKGDVSVKAAIEDFLDSKAKKATNTSHLYETAVNHFHAFLKVQEIVFLKDIDRKHVQAYMDEFAMGRSPKTAQGRLTHLRVWLNHCVRERNWLPKSPAASRDLNYTKKGKTAGERIPFTPEEVTSILRAVEEMPEEDRERARALILLLLFSGMRISDATFVERAYIDRLNNFCYWMVKGSKELEASIELQPQVMAALQALSASRVYFFQPDRDDDYRTARYALRHGGKFDKAMPDYKSRVRETSNLVIRVMRLAGIMDGGCHRFRHTFAVNLLSAGVGVYEVCKFMGHSDVRVTEGYLHLIPGYRERIAQRTRLLAYEFPLAVVAG